MSASWPFFLHPRTFARVVALALGLGACVALAASSTPPGDELEEPEPPKPLHRETQVQPPGPEVKPDLSILDAWEPDEPNVGAAAVTPPPTKAPQWTAPVGMDPRSEARKSFVKVASRVDSALAQKRWNDARVALDQASAMKSALGPHELQRIASSEARLGLALEDERAILRATVAWLHACGPDAVDACRRRALATLTSRQYPASGSARAKKRAEGTLKSDACVQSAELAGAHGQEMPECVEAAVVAYKRVGDRLMSARIHLARGQALRAKNPNEALVQFKVAARACEEERCEEVRRRALQSALPLYAQNKDVRAAAHVALQSMELAASRLPLPQRLYARTREADEQCTALDQEDGAGSCRKLEKSLLGHYTFRDFSRGQTSGQGLTPEVVQKVNAHYGVLIEECLASEKKHQEAPESEAYLLRWVVRNDGHVEQMHLDRLDKDQSPLADCLRAAFTVWRYPRYKGELQHVQQSFMVRVATRTP